MLWQVLILSRLTRNARDLTRTVLKLAGRAAFAGNIFLAVLELANSTLVAGGGTQCVTKFSSRANLARHLLCTVLVLALWTSRALVNAL